MTNTQFYLCIILKYLHLTVIINLQSTLKRCSLIVTPVSCLQFSVSSKETRHSVSSPEPFQMGSCVRMSSSVGWIRQDGPPGEYINKLGYIMNMGVPSFGFREGFKKFESVNPPESRPKRIRLLYCTSVIVTALGTVLKTNLT
jgi:hypothetical protein